MRSAMWVGGSIGRRGFPMIGTGKRSLSTYIKQLFSSGEQGFVYDPNDLTTMFQDAAGTVPVTGAGQPVGLMLDKSKGLALGDELVTNGDFDQGTNGFNVTGGELSIVDGKLRFTATTAGEAIFLRYYTNISSTDFYKLETAFTKTTDNDVNTYVYGNGPYKILGNQVVARGVENFSELLAIWFVPNVLGEYVDFDFISVKKLTGNHAYQTSSASRPILRQNAITGAYYLEFDGVDDFLVTNSIDFMSTDKISLFAGVRKLSDNLQIIAETVGEDIAFAGTFYLASNDGNYNGYSSFSRGTAEVNEYQIAYITTYPFPDDAVLSVKHDISNNLSSIRRNGVVGTDGIEEKGAGNFNNRPLYICALGGNSMHFNGHIYSLIGVGRLTTVDETIALEKLIAKNIGVTLSV